VRVLGIYETVLYASDTGLAAGFYSDALGLPLLEEADELSAVLGLDDGGVLLIFNPELSSAPGRRVPSHGAEGAGHVAFSVEEGALDAFAEELGSRGIKIEREIEWKPGARSLYIRDPAGNSVELVEGELWR
jgi:catechol 2,3-dioxygenase-like lactoylglutathione lyase family enzyme